MGAINLMLAKIWAALVGFFRQSGSDTREILELLREIRLEQNTRASVEDEDFTDLVRSFDQQLALLIQILAAVGPLPAVRFEVTVSDLDGGNPTTLTEGEHMQAIVGSKKLISIRAVDQFGNAAATDGAPTWAKGGDAIKLITVDEGLGGLAAVVELGTVAGVSGQVTITADGDPGPDQALFHSTVDFDLIADKAVSFQVSVSDAVPTPPVA